MHRRCRPRFGLGSILLAALFFQYPKLGRILIVLFAAMILLGLWWSTFPPK